MEISELAKEMVALACPTEESAKMAAQEFTMKRACRWLPA